MNESRLAGIRVLELGGYLAAPFAGHLLAELGADVIKIESPTGDPTRTVRHGEPGGTFIAYNRRKRSISLDLSKGEGQAVFGGLLASAHILVHNLSTSSMRRLNVTEEACHRVNDSLIYCRISGFADGPRSNDIASNPVIEALTGSMHSHRVADRPTRVGPSYFDQFAGAYAVIGILAELAKFGGHRSASNTTVQLGLYEVGLHIAARDLVADQQASNDKANTMSEFGHPGYGAYKTADQQWIYLLMLSDEHWRSFLRALSMNVDEYHSLASLSQRQERRDEVERIVSSCVGSLTFSALAARFRHEGFGFAEVKSPSDVLSDPQARTSGKLQAVRYGGSEFEVPTFPLANPPVNSTTGVSPPSLGEHTVELLSSLGYDSAECDRLVKSGIALSSQASDHQVTNRSNR